jgi:omega-6 fatty acid desaturase (delta-12 desaturase)
LEITQNQIPEMKSLKKFIQPYAQANTKKAVWQLIDSLVPYFALWALMIWTIQFSYLLTFGLIILASFFQIRLFIMFHDCGHNSFFSSLKANRIVGFIFGVMVFTPSEQWWRAHAIHHASSGNLDKRGTGDVMTLTIEEYKNKPLLSRIGYRLFRNPLIMFLLGPIYMFLISHRIPKMKLGKQEAWFQLWHNLALLAVVTIMSLLIGFKSYLLIQLPVIWLAGIMGIWLFFVQHQYEGVYWARSDEWNYVASALQGASYYKLPKILQWISGNIGFHHIHHLNPRIPNYNLEACHNNSEVFQTQAKTIPFGDGFLSIGLDLIDESTGQLVRFKDLR